LRALAGRSERQKLLKHKRTFGQEGERPSLEIVQDLHLDGDELRPLMFCGSQSCILGFGDVKIHSARETAWHRKIRERGAGKFTGKSSEEKTQTLDCLPVRAPAWLRDCFVPPVSAPFPRVWLCDGANRRPQLSAEEETEEEVKRFILTGQRGEDDRRQWIFLPGPDPAGLRACRVFSQISFPSRESLVADSGKLRTLDDLLLRLKAGDHRVLIYCQMTKMMDILEDFMRLRGYKHLRLDGSSGIQERRDLVAAFQSEGSDVFAFLLSTRAGGLGINLTAADTVVFYDSDWNPTADQQAMDRAHRLGQTKPVTVYRLVCKGSVEERILKRASRKAEIQRVVIRGGGGGGGDAASSPQMKAKEVVSLLLDDEELERKYMSANDVEELPFGSVRKPLFSRASRGRPRGSQVKKKRKREEEDWDFEEQNEAQKGPGKGLGRKISSDFD